MKLLELWAYMHLRVHAVHVQNMLLYAEFVFFCFTSLFHWALMFRT